MPEHQSCYHFKREKKTYKTKRNLFVFISANFNSFAFRSFTRIVIDPTSRCGSTFTRNFTVAMAALSSLTPDQSRPGKPQAHYHGRQDDNFSLHEKWRIPQI